MESTLSPSKTASAIWSRIVKPEQANLTPELARRILKLDFAPEDHRRIDDLSAKAQKGILTAEERAEFEEYIRVNNELALLQSKARLSLERANTTRQTKGEKPSAGKASAKRVATAKKAAANVLAASAGIAPATKAKKRLPAATIRALKELEAGKLNRYADADDLFQKLGIKLGKEDKA